ncbi:multiprotein bridging factor aMBF1 [Candidatus Woesearchaeota archaeon]|nr:multiprotein bridging factor aMBF1 [Candidatus Woesearchaeota archaeon]
MQCEMCGKENEFLLLADVEGVELNLCKECSKYGTIKKRVRPQPRPVRTPVKMPERKERIQTITSDYSSKIKHAREKKGMKQVEVAKMIAERESVIASLESGKMEPSIKLARILEKALSITLVEELEVEERFSSEKDRDSKNVTIGDVINIKKR